MIEEGKIYDYESDWRPCNSGKERKIYFQNANRDSFYRIVDMDRCTIAFSDLGRIESIVDINKVLAGESDSEALKKLYLPIINSVADAIRPIAIPYKIERLKCFIESFKGGLFEDYDDVLGILYFKDLDTDEMIEVKRFFCINPLAPEAKRYEIISFNEYSKLKEKWLRRCEENVDNGSDKEDTGKH